MRARMLLVAPLLFVGACQDEPMRPSPAHPSSSIVDGRHGGWNAHFFFLPPPVVLVGHLAACRRRHGKRPPRTQVGPGTLDRSP